MSFKGVVHGWVHRYFSDEEAVIFALLLTLFFAALIFVGSMLMPFLTAVVVSYLLQGLILQLQRLKIPEILAILLAFSLFMSLLVAAIFWLLPMIWHQVVSLIRELPGMLHTSQDWLNSLHESYPQLISQEQANSLLNDAIRELRHIGQVLVSLSLSSLPSLLAWLVYLVLVPILVFFMLKDQRKLTDFVISLMPRKRQLMTQIWQEMDAQIANYIRGKSLEILIVAGVTWLCFRWLGLNYAELLALLVGFSVLVPYIGAAVVTLPVALIALFQFGFTSDFVWVIVIYGIIQALDGNVLVPLLFSEAVNLHPVSIILAVLFFGGLWGFWGVFFAIPLATFIKAIVNAWPRALQDIPPSHPDSAAS